MYSIEKLAHDIGRTVNPALEPIIMAVHGDVLGEWGKAWADLCERDRKKHAAEVKDLRDQLAGEKANYEQQLAAIELRHATELALERQTADALREAFTSQPWPKSLTVSLPYSGQVPAVLDGVQLPLLRIRWQDGQPNGEGEMPVPEGWVLDDDQASTWLDAINNRALLGL